MKQLSIWSVVPLLLPFLLVACGPGVEANTTPQFVEGLRTKIYHSISELNADAVAVVRITATDARLVEPVGTVPFTVTTVRVDQVLRGSVDGGTIKLRQLGSPSGHTVIEDASSLVQPGSSYVAFIHRFTFGPGRDTDQYVPVGGVAGLFLDQSGTLKRLDPESPDLPATITLTDLQKQVVS